MGGRPTWGLWRIGLIRGKGSVVGGCLGYVTRGERGAHYVNGGRTEFSGAERDGEMGVFVSVYFSKFLNILIESRICLI